MRGLLWCGVAASLIYVAAVLWGGAVTPGYDPFGQPISALTESGSSGMGAVIALLVLYNLLLGAFALGVWMRLRAKGPVFWLVAAALGDIALFGLLMLVFPMDKMGTPMTAGGLTHLVVAGFTSVWTMLAIGLMAWGWRRLGRPDRARVDLALLGGVALSGISAALGTGLGWPVAGLFERLTIGLFLVWVALTATRLVGAQIKP